MRISDWSSDVCSSDLTASWQTLTSESNADELSVDITFPGGLVHYDDGKHPDPHARSVAVQIQYREVGDVSWLTPTFSDKTFPDSWVSGHPVTFTSQPTHALRHGLRWSTPPRGQYHVRLLPTPSRRTPPNTTSHIQCPH